MTGASQDCQVPRGHLGRGVCLEMSALWSDPRVNQALKESPAKMEFLVSMGCPEKRAALVSKEK